jgi:hypothetical protein
MKGMVQIKPLVDSNAVCLGNSEKISADAICWQGIHVGAGRNDAAGRPHIFADLPIGHSAHWSYEVDLQSKTMTGPSGVDWLSRPLLESLSDPSTDQVRVKREIIRREKDVIILNCLDMMYGHCLLKLLNASRHLEDNPERGLIVLVPGFLRWLVPDGVAEIWSVPLGLSAMKSFYPSIDRQIKAFSEDYDSIWLSEAFSHPLRFRIEDYTRIKPHDFRAEQNLVTFIWREDRLWLPHYPAKKLRKAGLESWSLGWQKRKVVKLFLKIRRLFPKTRFAVAGLGTTSDFPEWIKDYRTDCFDQDSEKLTAKLYADSRIVIGVHGSNMLLPSALAGMTLDLVPDDKWNNHPQDTLLKKQDARVGAFLHRFIPALASLDSTVAIICSMIQNHDRMPRYLHEDVSAQVLHHS